jgi:hypothetical protein
MMTLKFVEYSFRQLPTALGWFGNKTAEMSWQRKRRQHNQNVLP